MLRRVANAVAKRRRRAGRTPPRILVTHGWVKGNLGDFIITYMLTRGLRAAFPDSEIVLLSTPGAIADGDRKRLEGDIDRLIREPCETRNEWLFPRFDAVVNAPGGGLQNPGDRRGPRMLADAAACARLGVAHAFGSHSFHESFELELARQSLCVAREPASVALLQARGLVPTPAADLAFLYDYRPGPAQREPICLLFLRFDHFKRIEVEGRRLVTDGVVTELPPHEVVLASSDDAKDRPLVESLRSRFGWRYQPTLELDALIGLIGTAAHVVTDRYHPAIFARMVGTPFTLLKRAGNLRDDGLEMLFSRHSDAELGAMAGAGMTALTSFVRAAAKPD